MNKQFTAKEVTEKGEWEAFQLSLPSPQFLQSWNAGVMAGALGERIIRRGLYDEHGVLVSTLYANIIRARRGSYIFIPYGPNQRNLSADMLGAWIQHMRDLGSAEHVDFVRFCPFLPDTETNRMMFSKAGCVDAPIHTLAEYLWLLDITATEEDLMKGMSKTTRNLVRRAQRDGVQVDISTKAEDLDDFLRLHSLTKDRHAFTPYPDSLFRAQLESFSADGQVALLRASHNGEVIASAMVMYYGTMASYHHGASKPSKIPAAYLLQWEAIQEARRRGCTVYNFWGISDLRNTKHPFFGISQFKTRFGGRALTLLKSQDLPITKRYHLTRLIETARRIRRGFGWKRHNY